MLRCITGQKAYTMATTKPRLTITLEPHTHAVISELAELQGRPRARVIAELIESTVPILERTCYVLALAKRASSGVSDDFKASLEHSEAKIKQMMDDAMGQMDMLATDLSGPSQSAETSERKAGRAASPESRSETSLPPHSNTGVTIGDNSKTSNKNKH